MKTKKNHKSQKRNATITADQKLVVRKANVEFSRGRAKRFELLRKSKTVGEFLKKASRRNLRFFIRLGVASVR